MKKLRIQKHTRTDFLLSLIHIYIPWMLMVPPLADTSSIMFSASTMGICISMSCSVR